MYWADNTSLILLVRYMFGNVIILLPISVSLCSKCFSSNGNLPKTYTQDLYFYIPKSSIFPLSLTEVFHPKPDSLFYIGKTNYGVSADGILGFSYPGPLNDLIRIPVASLEKWLAEDEVLQGTHPKDPYKRIETFPSSREIRIEYQGTTVITSSQNIFFYETMLRPRYYLNPGALLNDPDDPDVSLVESDTTTFCTYKGMAK